MTTAFSGEILNNTASFGTESIAAYLLSGSVVNLDTSGSLQGVGSQRGMAVIGSGVNPIPYFSLSCLDSFNVRRYWVDQSITMQNAPTGSTYITSSLINEGRF